MRITNHSERLILVAGLYIARGRTAQVPDDTFRAWAATEAGGRLKSSNCRHERPSGRCQNYCGGSSCPGPC